MKIRSWMVGAIAASLALTACGGGETEPEAQDTETTSEAPSETEEPSEEMTDDPMADWPEKIVFGFVPSQEAEQLQDDIKPFVDAVQTALGIEVEGFVATEYAGLVEAMGTEQADFGFFGPTGYVLAEQRYDIEPLIQAVRFGSGTYHGQIFTNDASVCKEAPAPGAFDQDGLKGPTDTIALQVGFNGDGTEETLDDGTAVDPGLACEPNAPIADLVKGKRFAFGSETSTSATVFPTILLQEGGATPDEDFTAIYTGGHDSAVTAVYNGDADFGASFDDARRTIRKTNPDVGSKVIVIGITGEIPNDLVAVRSAIPDSLKQAFYDAVEEFLSTEEGQAIFDEIYGWTEVRPAVDSDFDIVRKNIEVLNED